MNKYKFAAIVPAYNPGQAVKSVVSETAEFIDKIYLIDDGSDNKNKEYLRACLSLDKVSLITLPENRGKGHALITGLREALKFSPDYIITIDSDGQHNPQEIIKFIDFLGKENQPLDFLIGSRNNIREMPFRSKFGNLFTAFIFYFFFRNLVVDTQSGFRAFSRAFAEDIVKIIHPGRYETEMKMLIYAANSKCSLHEIPIDTIYIEGNRNSKFRPVKDSARVLSVFSNYVIKFLLDYLVFLCLVYILNIYFIYSHIVSRAISEAYAFAVNRRTNKFNQPPKFKIQITGIIATIFSICSTAALLYVLVELAGISKAAAKPATEIAMAFFGFMALNIFKSQKN